MSNRQTTHKTVRERLDIDFRPGRTRVGRARRWAYWGGFLAALGVLAYYASMGDARIYMAGELTPVHASVEGRPTDCSACHSRIAQPALRFITLNERARSVGDEDCRGCHPSHSTHDHSPRMVVESARDCVMCHREHRGREALVRVADRHCTKCHANLEVSEGRTELAARIGSLAEHPEFAVLDGAETGRGAGHAMHERVRRRGGGWVDKTGLKFNHDAHLKAEGVLTPWQQGQGGRASRRKLACGDCHERREGASMGVVSYERHCSSCHPLRFHRDLSGPGGDLRHTLFQEVREEVRLRLLAAGRAEQVERTGEFPPRLPNKQQEEADPKFRAALESVLSSVKRGCALCHRFPEPIGEQGPYDVEVERPATPRRWLPYSEFRHGAHEEYACVLCHGRNPPDGAALLRASDPLSTAERTLRSASSEDILLPSVRLCGKCHTSRGPAPWVTAKADCVECHAYHH